MYTTLKDVPIQEKQDVQGWKSKSIAKSSLSDSTAKSQMKLKTTHFSTGSEKDVMACGKESFGKSLRIEEEFGLEIYGWEELDA